MASAMSFSQPAQFVLPWLTCNSTLYQVQSIIGQGTFGTVAKCIRMTDAETVAMKIMKYEDHHVIDAQAELMALLRVSVLDPEKSNVVKWHGAFYDRGYFCMEFEHLDKSLRDFMKERQFQPLTLREIRPIVQQVANALDHLKRIGMTHADLKVDNVMLVNHEQQPYKVKVIDFGLSNHVSEAELGSYIQTRPYRAPEILLGLPFTEAVDMWSLGCIAAEMYTGNLLYPGMSEYDMMRFIVETQGQPPDHLLNLGLKTSCFFEKDPSSPRSLWKLKKEDKFSEETGIQPKETRKLKLTSLDELKNVHHFTHDDINDIIPEVNDMAMFLDLLKGMLHPNAAHRLTPSQVLAHPFITMSHILEMYESSPYVRSCYETMGVCQDVTQTSETSNTGWSQQPPSTSQVCHTASHSKSSPSGWTQSGVSLSGKRKLAQDEDSGYDSYDRTKREVKRARKRSCQRSSHAPQDPRGQKKFPAESTHSSSSTLTEPQARSGQKRKASGDEDVLLLSQRSSPKKRPREPDSPGCDETMDPATVTRPHASNNSKAYL